MSSITTQDSGSTVLPDREKPGPNRLGFPVRSRPPNCLPRKRGGAPSPHQPAQPTSSQAWAHLLPTGLGHKACPAVPSGLGEKTDAVPCPNHILPGSSGALKPPSQARCLQEGGWALGTLAPKSSSLTHGKAPSTGYLMRVSHIWGPPLPARQW